MEPVEEYFDGGFTQGQISAENAISWTVSLKKI